MGRAFPEHPFSNPRIRPGSIIASVERRRRFYCKIDVEGGCSWAKVVNPPDGSARLEPGFTIPLSQTLVAFYLVGDGQAWAVIQNENLPWADEDWYRVLFMHNPVLTAELDALAQAGPTIAQTTYDGGA